MVEVKLNESLPIKQRIGQIGVNNRGLKMTIIAYRKANDIDIQFEDGTIVVNRRYCHFLSGSIAHTDNARCHNINARIGEVNINNQGLKMTIIAYRSATDLDVQFESDKTIVKNRTYTDFKRGTISNSNEYSDRISIPEKFMINTLKQLNLSFVTQLNKSTLKWCENYKYDFYIPSLNMIVETHGEQHYENGFGRCGGRTSKEEQLNDKLKKELALNNNIDNYIIIDCRKSEFDWLKENVIKELNDYFNLSNINWELVWENSLKNLVWEVEKLVNFKYTNEQIAEILNISKHTVMRYKKQLGIKTQHEVKQENLLKTKELIQQGKTVEEVAKILNVWKTTIINYIKELNL